jgi:hypothetical protein
VFFLRVFASSRELNAPDSGTARCGCGQWARARGSEPEGVLPPHPRPLSRCGGEGGLVGSFQLAVFSWQFSVAVCFFFASSRELNSPDSRTARCGSGQRGMSAGQRARGCVAPSPPTPLPLRHCCLHKPAYPVRMRKCKGLPSKRVSSPASIDVT